MIRRFGCGIRECRVCRQIDAIDRWLEDRRRKRARQDEAIRQSNERLRRLLEEAKRARREDDPMVN